MTLPIDWRKVSHHIILKKRKPIEFPASVISRIHGVLLLAMATDAELISNFV